MARALYSVQMAQAKQADSCPAAQNPARQEKVLAAGAQLFATRDYAGTSIRDIGEKMGLLAGSHHHYIRLKEVLLVRIHDRAFNEAEADNEAETEIRRAIDDVADPDSLTTSLMNDLRAVPETVRELLVATRETFEGLFRDLVAAAVAGQILRTSSIGRP
ncbi:hypothetical protein GCM10010990_11190 [Croceicoccus mobilis]|uniref:HTH tetR-type domain-containing protein n=1 Tax=Croceicoccus mobilis TaxID=1703339 RepID=A0A916YW03_9SPHN|nr:TetR/AcrR family transcriptional regulator [Croceicoccus mobilis]GGD63460.1 hypothetical protein GCM10010990_11190 [Croceicoccus mobilis]